jgi:hypothetical protein
MFILKSILGLVIGAVVASFLSGCLGPVFMLFMGGKEGGKFVESIQVYVMSGGGLIGFLIPFLDGLQRQSELNEEERKQRNAKQAQEERERDQAAAQLVRQTQQLASLLAETQHDFMTIPELVPSADADLDRAERKFAEGAFIPFWDEIERATEKLAAYNDGVRRIIRNAKDYERDAATLAIRIPKFSLPEGELPDARPVARRLSQIVEIAHRNINFTTVYNQRVQIHEQRKTNQLLYAGFSSLGDAISSLGSVISSSLDDLSRSVHSSLADILQAQHEQTDTMKSNFVQQGEAQQNYQDEHFKKLDKHAEKTDEVKEMVDGIWRKKKPPRL